MRLGKREIDDATCPEGKSDRLYFDDDLKGFVLRVTDTGAKVFLFQYRVGGMVRRTKIGTYGDFTPAQARKRAAELRQEVAGGGDPVAERRAATAAAETTAADQRRRKAADALTFDKLIEQWEAVHLRHRRPRYRKEAVRALRRSLQQLGKLPAEAIDADAARRAIHAIPTAAAAPGQSVGEIHGGTIARRVRTYARSMYSWAIGRGLVQVNPFAAVAAEGRETPRERTLSDAEIGEVWGAAGGLGWPWGPYIRFLMLTIQRQVECAGAGWAELSPDLSTWELPGSRTKNGKAHLVHLAEPARAILRQAPRIEGSPLIFTTTRTTPISGFSKAKKTLDRAIVAARAKAAKGAGTATAPLVPWRLHDFRRTGVTAMARFGVRVEAAEKVLNHTQGKISGITAVYQRHDFLVEREAAMRLWADHVLAMAGETPKPPRRRRRGE